MICNKVALSEEITLNTQYFNWAVNENKNLKTLLNHAHAETSSTSIFKDVPALMIGAGPSLKATLPFLKKIKENNQALIISASTVLRILEKEGITPHFTVIIEGREQKHFSSLPESYIKQLVLIAALQTHTQHLKYRFRKIFWFHHETSPTTKLVEQMMPEALPIPSSGNVICDSLQLAINWGCNPIALCGCDMAYDAKQKYFDGLEKKDGDKEEINKKYFPVPGQKGENLWAPAEFIAYAQSLENMIEKPAVKKKKQVVYNLSVGGRKLKGTIEIAPEEFYRRTLNQVSKADEIVLQQTSTWKRPAKEACTIQEKHSDILKNLHKTLQEMQKPDLNPLTKTAHTNTMLHLLNQLSEFNNGSAQLSIPWIHRLHSGGREEEDLAKLTTTVFKLYKASQKT